MGVGKGLMGAGDGQGGELRLLGSPSLSSRSSGCQGPWGWADRRDVNTGR